MTGLDAALARHVEKWMKLSGPKLRDRLDLWVAKFDPAGVRVSAKVEDDRYVEIVPAEAGMAGVFGQHPRRRRRGAGSATGGVGGHGVRARSAHPRGSAARMRAGRWRAGEASLACRCGREDCAAAAERHAAAAAVIHVLAEQATLDGTQRSSRGICPGSGFCRRVGARGRQVREAHAGDGAHRRAPDPGYRPTASTVEFIRWRDLTCRWPGCDRPAEMSDIDHTVPWPHGPTHPSNTKRYCRIHHLIKTFCAGSGLRSAATRRHHRVDRSDRARLRHRTPRRGDVPRTGAAHRRAATSRPHLQTPDPTAGQ